MWRFLLILTVSFPVFALEEDWRVQRLNERYDDFFAHLRAEEAYAQKRQAAGAEVEKERKVWAKEMDAARLAYIKAKKAPPDERPAYREWALEDQKWHSQQETARRHYVEIENRIERLKKSAKRIPEDREYDLDP